MSYPVRGVNRVREAVLAVLGALTALISTLLWLAFPAALQALGAGYVRVPSTSLILLFTGVSAIAGAVASLCKPTAFKPLVSMIPRLLGFMLVASAGTSITISTKGVSIFLDLSPIFYLLLFLFVLLPTLLEALETFNWWLEKS